MEIFWPEACVSQRMSRDPNSVSPAVSYTGRYYAMPLRGRLTPHEGGAFAPGSAAPAAAAPASSSLSASAPSAVIEGDPEKAQRAAKKAGFSFAGFLDIINPLQHIPVISSIYRRLTGDELTPVGRVAGDTLFFGVVGLAGSLINTAIEKVTGKDAGDHVLTAMLGKEESAPDPLQDVAHTTPDDGTSNAMAALAPSGPQRGRVTVHPKGGMTPQTLDAATLDALARTIGSAEPLAHLMPPPGNNISDSAAGGAGSPSSGLAMPDPGLSGQAAVIRYNDALMQMQQSLERYQTGQP